jgi:hypothetical protein
MARRQPNWPFARAHRRLGFHGYRRANGDGFRFLSHAVKMRVAPRFASLTPPLRARRARQHSPTIHRAF